MAAAAAILADLLVLFVAAKVVGAVFVRLGQPAVIRELLAGVVIGPSVLGLVGVPNPALIAAFQGDETAAAEALTLVLELFAEFGVVLLLFFVGLETRLVGVLGIAVPFAGGTQ